MEVGRPETGGVSVVALGSFNPRIFEPAWLVRHGLVPGAEADAARFEMIDRELVQMVLPWVEIVVRPERLQMQSREEITDPGQIRDLVAGIMALLPHTPISRMGINTWAHYRVASTDLWHEIGHRLAPKDLWSKILKQPGMLSTEIRGVRPDDRSGAVNVSVQPSQIVDPGIYINVNDDVVLAATKATARDAEEVLQDIWAPAQERAATVIAGIMALASEVAAA